MKKKIFLGVLIALLILPVFVSASRIPEPPHLGLWVLRDGQLLPVKAQNIVERVGVRGFDGATGACNFKLRKTDKVLFFFGYAPTENVYLTCLKWTDVVGNPYSGMHRVNLSTADWEIPFKINPLGKVRDVSLFEIIVDFEKDFLIGSCALHFGYLTSSFARNPDGYVFDYNPFRE